jgi:hypothetical protein
MATKWFGSLLGGGSSDPMEILADLARNKTPVRIEIENTLIKFNSQMTLKKGTVVIAKPLGLKEGLNVGSYVRIRIPGGGRRELRLQVNTPHFNLTSGNSVFVCDAPESEVSARRESDRYDVTRYNNLRLVLGAEQFRLVDVSSTGFKVLVTNQQAEHFPLGGTIHSAFIMLGANARVDLDKVIPRSHHGGSIGCAFEVSPDGVSARYLNHLLASLTKAETDRMATQA